MINKRFRTRGLLVALTLIGTMAFDFNLSAYAAPKIGTSAAVKGNVFVSTRGAQRKAQVRDAIKLEDRVVTKDDSALQILLLDRSTFTVGQNCEMVIDKFVYDPETSSGKISAKVAKGAFRFMSGRIGKNNPTNAKVSTPSATIGIRGTFFEGIVGQDAMVLAQLGGIDTSSAIRSQASLVILRGPGRRRNTLDTAGRIEVSNSSGSVTVSRPDYAVFVPSAGSAPIGPFRVTNEMREYLDFFLRSAPSGQPETPREIAEGGKKASGQDQFEVPTTLIDPVVEEVQDGITDPNGTPPTEIPTTLNDPVVEDVEEEIRDPIGTPPIEVPTTLIDPVVEDVEEEITDPSGTPTDDRCSNPYAEDC